MKDVAELLSYAFALEVEAGQRYAELAELMRAHNNVEVAGIFAKMADIEKLHADHIRQLLMQHNAIDKPIPEFGWLSPEGPETTDLGELQYLLTPHQALTLALFNEQRACDFYRDIERDSMDAETRYFAREMLEEEKEHVAWIRNWLESFPEPEDGWDHDDDAPAIQD